MTVRRGAGTGSRWVLPVILALAIIALVAVFVFGSRIKSAVSPATATPQRAAVAQSTSTPLPGKGVSTPVPGATACPTQAGLQLCEITHTQNAVSTIQSGADRGDARYTFYRDPRQVVQKTLPQYGFTQPSFEIVAPNPSPTPTPYAGQDGRPLVKFIVSYSGKFYTVFVAQPAKHGPQGIWLIVTIDPGKQ
ncbi:MAG TPA: hypothetical protein VKX16_11810 [Chloroflexota bacterium]|nr:hypothetical protein [Chloroflexota bacterium]